MGLANHLVDRNYYAQPTAIIIRNQIGYIIAAEIQFFQSLLGRKAGTTSASALGLN